MSEGKFTGGGSGLPLTQADLTIPWLKPTFQGMNNTEPPVLSQYSVRRGGLLSTWSAVNYIRPFSILENNIQIWG